MKRIGKLAVLFVLAALMAVTFVSCQNIFGSSTDTERVYGDWVYQKDGGFEIRLSLYKNGTYRYEEIASYGKTLYENSGKFSISPTRLILKGIDTDDGDRFSVFSISMKNSTENEDILELVPTLTKKYTFKRVASLQDAKTVVVSDPSEPKENMLKLDIEGSWRSDLIGTVEIKGDKILVIPAEGTAFSFMITEVNDNTLTLDVGSTGLDAYSEVSYFKVNGTLYVVFPKLSSDALAFSAI